MKIKEKKFWFSQASTFSLFIIIAFTIIGAFYYFQNKRNVMRSFDILGHNLTKILNEQVIQCLKSNNTETYQKSELLDEDKLFLKNKIKELTGIKGLHSVSIWDNNYEIFLSNTDSEQLIDELRLDLIYKNLQADPIIELQNKKFFAYKENLLIKKEQLGYLVVLLDAEDYFGMIDDFYWLLSILLIYLVISLGIIKYSFENGFFTPLTTLIKGFRRLSHNDTSVTLDSNYKDEYFSKLAYLHNKILQQIELNLTDNKDLEAKLSQKQKMYLDLLHNCTIGVFFFNYDGFLFEANKKALSIIDMDEDDSWTELNFYSIDTFANDEIKADFDRIKTNNETIQNEVEINIGEKKFKSLIYKFSAINLSEDQDIILLSIDDVSEERRVQNEQATQKILVKELLKKNSMIGISTAFSDACFELFNHDALSFDRYDRRNNYLTGILTQDTPEGGKLQNYPSADNRPISEITYRVLGGETILINRKETDRQYFASAFGAVSRISKSFMVVPIRHQKITLGVVSIHSYSNDFFTDEDLEIFSGLANLCAEPMLRIQKQSKQTVISELIEQINRPYQNNDLGDLVANAAHKLFFYNSFYLLMLDSDNKSLNLTFSKRFSGSKFREVNFLDDINQKIIDNLQNSLPYFDNNEKSLLSNIRGENTDPKSEMAVGIYWGEQLEGIILIQSNVDNYFNKDDLKELVSFSNNLGGVIAKHIELQKNVKNQKQLSQMVKHRTRLLVDEISNRVSLEEKLSSIIDTSLDAIIVIDYQGIIKVFNISAENMFKYSKDEIIGKSVHTIIPQEGKIKSLNNLIDLIVMNKKKNFDTGVFKVNAVKSDNSEFEVEISASVSYEDNNPILIIVLRDTSEKKRIEDHSRDLELQLITNSRLAKVGEIASGISIEMRKPIEQIAQHLESVSQVLYSKTTDEKLIKNVENDIRNAERILKMVEHLENLKTKEDCEYEPLNFREIFQDIQVLLAEQILMYDIEFNVQFKGILPKVDGNKEQIEHVILDVVQNAIDATRNSTHPKIECEIFSSSDKRDLIIKIRDNGKGVPKEYLSKIFDPFFSTKKSSDAGLGLTVANGIVQTHSGKIYCNSRPGKGATFTIELPTLL